MLSEIFIQINRILTKLEQLKLVGLIVMPRVYFRPLKKGVVLPLTIVKKG